MNRLVCDSTLSFCRLHSESCVSRIDLSVLPPHRAAYPARWSSQVVTHLVKTLAFVLHLQGGIPRALQHACIECDAGRAIGVLCRQIRADLNSCVFVFSCA